MLETALQVHHAGKKAYMDAYYPPRGDRSEDESQSKKDVLYIARSARVRKCDPLSEPEPTEVPLATPGEIDVNAAASECRALESTLALVMGNSLRAVDIGQGAR